MVQGYSCIVLINGTNLLPIVNVQVVQHLVLAVIQIAVTTHPVALAVHIMVEGINATTTGNVAASQVPVLTHIVVAHNRSAIYSKVDNEQ